MKKLAVIVVIVIMFFTTPLCYAKSNEIINENETLNVATITKESIQGTFANIDVEKAINAPFEFVFIFLQSIFIVLGLNCLVCIVLNIIYKNSNTLTDIKSRRNLDKIFKSLEHVK